MTDGTQTQGEGATRLRIERVQATTRKHWLGLDASGERKEAADEIRNQYYVTAAEYYKAALRLYESLTSQNPRSSAPLAFSQVNRNAQLFVAYSILWEAFEHIYTAASFTHFARFGPETAPLEGERTSIDRVLREPILPHEEVAKIGLLKNGESVGGTITRLCNHSSREIKAIYGVTHNHSITDMAAFVQGVVELEEKQDSEGKWIPVASQDHWLIRALDDAGNPIEPDSPTSADKYRSVIKYHCHQIRNNLNFVGKSDSSIDDAILIIRAFCLVDPIVHLLLQESRKDVLFGL